MEREKEREHEQGRDKRGREKIQARLCAVNAEPDVRLKLTD